MVLKKKVSYAFHVKEFGLGMPGTCSTIHPSVHLVLHFLPWYDNNGFVQVTMTGNNVHILSFAWGNRSGNDIYYRWHKWALLRITWHSSTINKMITMVWDAGGRYSTVMLQGLRKCDSAVHCNSQDHRRAPWASKAVKQKRKENCHSSKTGDMLFLSEK